MELYHVRRETELIKMRSWEPTSSSSWNIFITTKSWNAGMRNVGVLHDGSRVMSPPPKKVCFFQWEIPTSGSTGRFLAMFVYGAERGGVWEVGDHSEFFSQNEPVVTYLDPPCRHILRHMTRLAHDGEFVQNLFFFDFCSHRSLLQLAMRYDNLLISSHRSKVIPIDGMFSGSERIAEATSSGKRSCLSCVRKSSGGCSETSFNQLNRMPGVPLPVSLHEFLRDF